MNFVVDDLTDLRQVEGNFDFLVDYGSMDEMVGRARSHYVDTLLKLSGKGTLCLFAFTKWPDRWWVRLNPYAMRPGELERRFGPYFDLEPMVGSADWVAYLMRRRGERASPAT